MIKELKEIRYCGTKIDLKEQDKKVQDTESKILTLEDQVRDLKLCNEKLDLKYEIKARELQIRVRGLVEEEGEKVRERIINILQS